MKMKKAYGIARTRDRHTGQVVKRTLKPYTMCIHTNAASARENMLVLIAEEYESDIETSAHAFRKEHRKMYEAREIKAKRREIRDWQPRHDGVSNTLTGVQKDNLLFDSIMDKTQRPQGKGWVWDEETEKWFRIRRLTPRECFRLMDVKDSDIDKLMSKENDKKGHEEQAISNSQLYKCAGNSIVVTPMALTLENLLFPEDAHTDGEQMSLF